MRHGQVQCRAIAGGKQLLLALAATVPDRTDGVNDVLGRQPMTPRDLGSAGRAAAERSAFDKQFRPRGAMDRAVNATATEQRLIGGIDDGVDRKRGDVGNADLKPRSADFGNEQCGNVWHQNKLITPIRPALRLVSPRCSSHRYRRNARPGTGGRRACPRRDAYPKTEMRPKL